MFVLIDRIPLSLNARITTQVKIFVKEGLYLGNWRDVFKDRTRGGSITIPEQLAEGLHLAGAPFLHNPATLPAEATVVVLKDPRALRWALEQKRRKKIRRLLAGPFITTLPHEADSIMLDPQLDGLIFFSTWHRDLFLRLAESPPAASYLWYAGVDPNQWPKSAGPREKILLYDKNPDADVRATVLKTVQQSQRPYEVLTYGTYDFAAYRKALAHARLAIFLSRSETQGLAMFEAWSSGVPTLHWNPGVMRYSGHDYRGASSCAYLTPECGLAFAGANDFAPTFEQALNQSFDPRAVVLDRFTRSHSVQKFLDIVEAQK